MHNPDPGRDGHTGTVPRRAAVPEAGSWWPLPRIKGPSSTDREIWPVDLSQLGLKLPNISLGTYAQIFKSSIEVLVRYRPWRRSHLAPGIWPGQKSFRKLPGPSGGPGSRGGVFPRRFQVLFPLGLWGRGIHASGAALSPACHAPQDGAAHRSLSGHYVWARGPSPGQYRGDRVTRGQEVSPTYPPFQDLRLAGPGAVSSCPTLDREEPHVDVFRPAPRGAVCGIPVRGVPIPCTSPAPGGPLPSGRIRRFPLSGDMKIRVSRGHPLRQYVGQRRERVSGVLSLSPPTSCPACGWGSSNFIGSPTRAVRWRRPMRQIVRPPWRSTVAAPLSVMFSGRRTRLTAPWPFSCRLLGRLPLSLTTRFASFPGTSGGTWWNSGMRR